MKKTLIASAVTVERSHAAKEFLAALAKLEGDFDVLLVDYSPKEVYAQWLTKGQQYIRCKVMRKEFPEDTEPAEKRAVCHELIREHFLKRSYDALLLVEQDIILPSDALKNLRGAKKEVIAGVSHHLHLLDGQIVRIPALFGAYTKEQQEHLRSHKEEFAAANPRFYSVLEKNGWDFSEVKRPLLDDEVAKGKGVIAIKGAPFDCLLIARDIVEQVRFRSENGIKQDDVKFFLDLKEKRIAAFAHTDVQCTRKMAKATLERARKRANAPPSSAG